MVLYHRPAGRLATAAESAEEIYEPGKDADFYVISKSAKKNELVVGVGKRL